MPFLFAQLNTPMPAMANTAPTKLLKQSIVVAMLLLIVGCKGFLSPHKIAIQQGNIVTKDMMDKLKVGMEMELVIEKYIERDGKDIVSYFFQPVDELY